MKNAIYAGWFAGLSAVAFVGIATATNARSWIVSILVAVATGLLSFHFAEKFFGRDNNQS